MKFCEYIKKARELAGLTQESAAEMIKVSVTTIQNWEKGQMPSGKENLNRIAETYKVNYDEFWSFYAEEMMPRNNVKDKVDFPYFLFSDEKGKEIASLYLDTREQELLGLEYLYSQPNIIFGEVNMDNKFAYSCDLSSKQNSPLSTIPYQYIKEHGVFNTVALHNDMSKKIGKYKDIIIEYLIRHPYDIFDTTTIEANELYLMFKPELTNVLNVLIKLSSRDNKCTLYTFDETRPFNEYDVCAQNSTEQEAIYFVRQIKKEIDYELQEIIVDKFMDGFSIEGFIIDKIRETDDINELYKSIEFKEWYKKYFIITKDDTDIYISMSDEGKKLLDWYNSTGKDVVSLYPDVEKMLQEYYSEP